MDKKEITAAALIVTGLLLWMGAIGNAEFYDIPLASSHWIQIVVGLVIILSGVILAGICIKRDD